MKWVLVLLMLAGCGSGPTKELNLQKQGSFDTVTITWVKQTPKSCGAVNHPKACTTCATNSKGRTCIIEMPENTESLTVAEEFWHAFGYEHQGASL